MGELIFAGAQRIRAALRLSQQDDYPAGTSRFFDF